MQRRVVPPKTFVLAIKTHKLTLYLDVTHPDTTMISDLKDQALSALKADVLAADHDGDVDMSEWTVPTVESVDDFELSRALREKGRPTGAYEVMQHKTFVRHCLSAWEHIFIQFKDADGEYLAPSSQNITFIVRKHRVDALWSHLQPLFMEICCMRLLSAPE